MTKSIDSLIEDVYGVLTGGYSTTEENEKVISTFGDSMKELLRSRLQPRNCLLYTSDAADE